MANKNTYKSKKKTTYTYQYLDGRSCEIEVGKDGVTKELLSFLEESDREMDLQMRYQRQNTDYFYLNCSKVFSDNPGDTREDPVNQLPDRNADIFSILFPEKPVMSSEIQQLSHVMDMLTEKQRDLIWEAYGLHKGDTEIAREQHVTREAIQNRRKKIIRRIEKLLKESASQKP